MSRPRTSPCSRRCSCSRARSATGTGGGGCSPSVSSGSAWRRSPAAWPHRSTRSSSPGSLQGAAGALLVPRLARDHHAPPGRARSAVARSGSGRRRPSAFTLVGPLVGGLLVQAASWRAAFLVNVPLVALGVYALRHVPESRDEHATRAGSTGPAPRCSPSASAGSPSGQRGASSSAGRTPPPTWPSPLGFAGGDRVPVPDGRRPYPLVPPGLFRSPRVQRGQLGHVRDLRRPVREHGAPAAVPAGRPGLLARRGPRWRRLPPAILLVLLSTRFGRLAGRRGSRLPADPGPAADGGGRPPPRPRPEQQRWRGRPCRRDPASFLPPPASSSTSCPRSSSTGSASRSWSRRCPRRSWAPSRSRRAGLASAINNAVSRAGAPLVGAALFIALSATFYPALAALLPGVDTAAPSFRAAVQPLVAVRTRRSDRPSRMPRARRRRRRSTWRWRSSPPCSRPARP